MAHEATSTHKARDRAIAVHPRLAVEHWGEYASISRREEFERLVEAGDCDCVGSLALTVRRASPGSLFGAGQVAEVAALVAAQQCPVVFVDHQLSPVQQRNLEKAWNAKVVDRTGLILEIVRWVIDEASRQPMAWRAGARDAPTISVNHSAAPAQSPGLHGPAKQARAPPGMPASP